VNVPPTTGQMRRWRIFTDSAYRMRRMAQWTPRRPRSTAHGRRRRSGFLALVEEPRRPCRWLGGWAGSALSVNMSARPGPLWGALPRFETVTFGEIDGLSRKR
jgi:hypothetical protein